MVMYSELTVGCKKREPSRSLNFFTIANIPGQNRRVLACRLSLVNLLRYSVSCKTASLMLASTNTPASLEWLKRVYLFGLPGEIVAVYLQKYGDTVSPLLYCEAASNCLALISFYSHLKIHEKKRTWYWTRWECRQLHRRCSWWSFVVQKFQRQKIFHSLWRFDRVFVNGGESNSRKIQVDFGI